MATVSEILAGAGKLLTGLAAAQIINMLALPIITRVYGIHDFAVLALYISAVSLLNPFVSLRYSASIPLPRTDILAINLAIASMVIGLVSIALVAIAIVALDTWLLSFTALKLLDGYLWLIPVGLLFTSMYELASFWSTRRQTFGVVARSKVSQSVNGNLAKILLGHMGLGPIGLLLGHIVSQSAGFVVQLRKALPEIRNLLPTITLGRVRKSLVQYWRFPAFQLPSQLFSIGAEQAPVLFVAASYQAEEIGNFSLAMVMITLPVTLIAKTVSNTFYAGLADIGRHRGHEVWNIALQILKRILLITILIGAITMLFAEWLVPVFLGAKWRLAGAVVAQMTPYLVGIITFTGFSRILDVFHRQDLKLRLDVQRFVIAVTLILWGGSSKMLFMDFVQAYSIAMFAHFIISTGCIFFFIRKFRNEVFA